MNRDFTPSEIFFALPATAITPTSFIANWQDIADEYYITVARDPMFWDILNDYRDLRVFTNAQQVSGLTLGIRYYYKVRYKANGIYSDDSNIVSVYTLPAPVATAATPVAYDSFQMNWGAANGALSYKIYIYDNAECTNLIYYEADIMVSASPSADIQYESQEGLEIQPALTYYYRVKATYEAGDSEFSNTITVTTTATLPAYFGFEAETNTINAYYPTGIGENLGEVTNVIIPSQIEGVAVLHVEGNTWYENQVITELYIPNSVADICALGSCPALAYIRVGSGVTILPANFLFGCTALEMITGCAGVIEIYDFALTSCNLINSYPFNGNEETIGIYAFSESGLSGTVVIPDSVENLGEGVFSSCSIEGLTLGSGVTILPALFCASCNKLVSMIIPDTYTAVENGTFQSCAKMVGIDFGSGVETIGNHVLDGCTALESITIAAYVTVGDFNLNFAVDYATALLAAGTYILTEGTWVLQ
jgi:hypothetical protein